MTTANNNLEPVGEAAQCTFACAVCQDARPLETAVLPSGRCGHALCKSCWDGWMNRQFGQEMDGVQVMEGSVNCPVCREVGVTLLGRPVALHATPADESKEIEDMFEQIEKFRSRQKAIAEEMSTIANDIKRWEEYATEWHGHTDKIKDALERFDAAGGEGSGSG
ncbi:hypothetical protein FRC10_001697 [Ceratobasidium sp. 414]|nr:hypothetical protein FRC10_001697 [Ceratobasidium sp. 414]